MISQVADKTMIEQAYNAGVEFYINKPINVIEVQNVLGNIADKIRMRSIVTNIKGMFAEEIEDKPKNIEAFYGAIWGSAVMWGVKRGIYSSEAGMGSGAHAAAAAEVSHTAKQGLAQSFSVYVDTLFVCTATAIMILSTGMYNVVNEKTGEMLVENLPGVSAGTGYTQAAIDSFLPGFGSAFIAIAVFFFAFTTLLSFAFYTDANMSYIAQKCNNRKYIVIGVKIILTAIILFGAVRSSDVAWNLADIGVGLMSWVNLIALFILQKTVRIVLKDYEKQKKLGLDPVFDPDDCGIKNAGLWKDIIKNNYADLLEKKREKEKELEK